MSRRSHLILCSVCEDDEKISRMLGPTSIEPVLIKC